MDSQKKKIKLFRKLYKKYPISLKYFQWKARKIVKQIQYTNSLLLIIKCQLVKRKHRVFLRYNVGEKPLIFRRKTYTRNGKPKSKRLKPNESISWSKRIVMYLKKKRILDKLMENKNIETNNNSDSQNDLEINLSPDEVEKQLKAQLELLKSGKKNQQISVSSNELSATVENKVKLKLFAMDDDSNRLKRKNSFGNSSNQSFDISAKDAQEAGPSNIKRFCEKIPNDISVEEQSKSSQNLDIKSTNETDKEGPKKSFLDSLINKISTTNGSTKNSNNSQPLKNNQLKVIKPTIQNGIANKSEDNSQNIYEEDSRSSGDFLGFSENEMITPEVPGMLPTPVVLNKSNTSSSVFVSEDLDNFMRENSLDNKNEYTMELPLQQPKRVEDGLVCEGAVPPKLFMLPLPSEVAKPRTVAEKRLMLQKNKNLKYYMIENENSIYCELKKRSRDCKTNVALIKNIQNLRIPASRDLWKATSWLLTENGNFFFQIANIDGIDCKLIGGCGNNKQKILPYQLSKPIKKELKNITCSPNCKDIDFLKTIKIRYKAADTKFDNKLHLVPGNLKKFNTGYKPGPLSSKCQRASAEPNLGRSEIFKMPEIQMEIFPKLNQQFNEIVKCYLKMILPSESITKEWARFACSTLIQPDKKSEDNNASFTFSIPYLNDQKNILVRRKIFNRKEKFERNKINELEFYKNAKKSKDPIEVECANILNEMISSVAIGLSEDSLINNDPDIDYGGNNKANVAIAEKTNETRQNEEKKTINKSKNRRNVNTKSKLMSELKRLNATIIDAGSLSTDDVKESKCSKPYCHLGCVCMSLNSQPKLIKHCKQPQCMMECNCPKSVIQAKEMNSGISSQDVLMLRKQATARLAKMEREFSSTVVLTNNETLLINESQYERKRRCTKRYLNYYDSDESHIEGAETASTVVQKKRKISIKTLPKKIITFDDIVSVEESVVKQIKHCTVELNKLQHIDQLEKWCMVHCLYKCFCNCEDVTGKPFVILKDKDTLMDEPIYKTKARYSFDKNETTPATVITPPKLKPKINNETIITEQKPSQIQTNIKPPSALPNKFDNLRRDKLQILKYIAPNENVCRRTLKIPNAYSSRLKNFSCLKQKHFIENSKTDAILNERIRQSILYRPIRKIFLRRSMPKNDSNETESVPIKENETQVLPPLVPISENTRTQSDDVNLKPSQFLKISSVVSLSTPMVNPINSTANQLLVENNVENSVPQTVSLFTSKDLIQSETTSNEICVQDIHNVVLNRLNYLVTRRMHDICKLQAEETKFIKSPVTETIYLSHWSNFLQAYIDGIIYIWEVKAEQKVYFTCTMQNIMPFIKNAISVVNIKAIRKDNLPLFGKMLNAKVINQQTSNLSILMFGHHDFWQILGLSKCNLSQDSRTRVIKPTPQTHPFLSKKINKLYTVMAKCRVENERDKLRANNVKIIEQQTINAVVEKPQKPIENFNGDAPDNRLLQMNIMIRKLTREEILKDIFTIPHANLNNYRWLVLDIVDDFSHILFVDEMECLTHNKIKIAFQRSQAEGKMVRLANVNGKDIDCYVTKNDKDRIYLGPFSLNGNPQIVLYQNIDGKMLLREDFEKIHSIKRDKGTTGFWLCRSYGKVLFDMNTDSDKNNFEFDINSETSKIKETSSEVINSIQMNQIDLADTLQLAKLQGRQGIELGDGNLMPLLPGNYQIKMNNNTETIIEHKPINSPSPVINNAVTLPQKSVPIIASKPSTPTQKQTSPINQKLILSKKIVQPTISKISNVSPIVNKTLNTAQTIFKVPNPTVTFTTTNNSIPANIIEQATKSIQLLANSTITSLPYNIPSFIKISTMPKTTTSSVTSATNLVNSTDIVKVAAKESKTQSINLVDSIKLPTEIPSHLKNVTIVSSPPVINDNVKPVQTNPKVTVKITNSQTTKADINSNSKLNKKQKELKPTFSKPIEPMLMVDHDKLIRKSIVNNETVSPKNTTSEKKSDNNKRPRTISGYFFANVPEYPKFGGLKKDTSYLVKSSSTSALQLKNLFEVSKFLNNHVRKHCNAYKDEFKNVLWTFAAFMKDKTPNLHKFANEWREVSTLNGLQDTTILKPKQKVSNEKKKTNSTHQINSSDVIVIDD